MPSGSKKRFSITIEDIERGIPRTSWACAIAMTMEREFPGLEPNVVPIVIDDNKTVGHEVRIYDYDGELDPKARLVARYRLSGNASKWVSKYDHQGVGDPATFEMTSLMEERT